MLLVKEKPEDEREREEESDPHPSFMSRVDRRRRRGFEWLARRYEWLLDLAMEHRRFTLAAAALFVSASLALAGFVGLDFFPSVDAGLLRFHVRAPPGSRIEQTERIVEAVEQDVRKIVGPEQITAIDDNLGVPVFYNLGFVPSENADESDAEVTVGLTPTHAHVVPMMDRIRRQVRDDFPGTTLYFEAADIVSQVLNFGLPAPIDVQVQARDYAQALPFAFRLQRDLEGIPGATDVRLGQVLNRPALQVDVDRERAIQIGLHQQDVASSLLTSLSSSLLFAPNFWVNPQNNVNYNVIVQAPYFHVTDVPTLMTIPITAPSAGGAGAAAVAMMQPGFAPPPQEPPPPVTPIAPYLGSISTIRPITTRASIHHESVQPTIDVECNVQGRDLGAVSSDVAAAVARLGKLPPGVVVEVAGQSKTMKTAFGRLGLGMLVAVMLVYLLLVVLFQSWIDPLLILLAVPASLSGVLWMLAATRSTLNV
jgi:multidrug efflux pump subunit AcrB